MMREIGEDQRGIRLISCKLRFCVLFDCDALVGNLSGLGFHSVGVRMFLSIPLGFGAIISGRDGVRVREWLYILEFSCISCSCVYCVYFCSFFRY